MIVLDLFMRGEVGAAKGLKGREVLVEKIKGEGGEEAVENEFVAVADLLALSCFVDGPRSLTQTSGASFGVPSQRALKRAFLLLLSIASPVGSNWYFSMQSTLEMWAS